MKGPVLDDLLAQFLRGLLEEIYLLAASILSEVVAAAVLTLHLGQPRALLQHQKSGLVFGLAARGASRRVVEDH